LPDFAGILFSRWQQLQCSAGLCALLLLRSQPLQALNSSDLAPGLDEDVQFTWFKRRAMTTLQWSAKKPMHLLLGWLDLV